MTPDVSVVIPVYNAMPYLTTCITSVLQQTIGQRRLEILLVDDGSSDGSGEEIERFAAAHPATVRAFSQPNSGGPGRPRNVGISESRGRYVYLVDADDYLGPDALRRLVKMADGTGADLVLGRAVGVGRRIPQSMFQRSQPRADLFRSRVYYFQRPQKLHRRTLFDEPRLRFPEGTRVGEDVVFSVHAYLLAKGIAVVADYECYYAIRRDDGLNTTGLVSRLEGLHGSLQAGAAAMALVEEYVPPGAGRDALMYRHIRVDMLPRCVQAVRVLTPDAWVPVLESVRPLLESHLTPGVMERLEVEWRLRAYCLRQGLLAEFEHLSSREWQRLTAGAVAGPLHAAASKGLRLPDSLVDPTVMVGAQALLDEVSRQRSRLRLRGHARIAGVAADDVPAVQVVLRERTAGVDAEPPTTVRRVGFVDDASDPGGGHLAITFDTVISGSLDAGGAPLGPGRWNVLLRVQARGIERTTHLEPSPGLPASPARVGWWHRGRRFATEVIVGNRGRLSLRVTAWGPTRARLTARLRRARPPGRQRARGPGG